MPVVNKPEKSMALVPRPQPVQDQANQPRQPTSLQGLLRFAMEATRAEDAPNESAFQAMDEERRKFLENALKSMTIDVVEELQKQIEVLKKVENITGDQDVTEYSEAIETILEYIDQIDTANDFHKIGGFMILYPCLKCPNPKIRAEGCDLLAVLCQNNPYCQRVVLDNEFIPMLLSLIEKDQDPTVCTKAIYALAGIVRSNEEGFNQLKHYNGLPILLEVINKNNEKCIIKSTFLLESLCKDHPDVKRELISLGCIPRLISLISTERTTSHEYVLSLLVTLLEGDDENIKECKQSQYNLKEIILRHINVVKDNEQYKEEEEYCKRLLELLNS